MENGLNLRLLGPVQITLNGELVKGFESQKALALLFYLAYLGQPVSRSKLANLFWQSKSESRGLANLSRVIHNNKKLLPGYIQNKNNTVQFEKTDHFWIDTELFQELAQQDSIAALKAAVELVRGDLMEDIALIDCPEFDRWLINEQEHWHQRIADVYYRLIKLFTEKGDYSEGIDYASRLLILEPWREEAHRRMMLLLALDGQRLNALQQYNICCRILAEELGVEPSNKTKLLYERILRNEIINPTQVPVSEHEATKLSQHHQLPIDLPLLDGRQDEVEQILLRLQQPTCRLLTIVGDKSDSIKDDLALHAANNAAKAFRDGLFYAPFPANNEIASIMSFPDTEDAEYEYTVVNGKDHAESIYQYFRDLEILIVLTNVNEAEPVTEFLEGILKRSPGVKIMITASRSIGSPFEWIYEVSANTARDQSQTSP